MMKYLSIAFAAIILVSCSEKKENNEKAMESGAPQMFVDRSDWGGNISLHINKVEKLETGKIRYTILSTYENKPVGFILIKKNNENKSMFLKDGIQFLSMGDTSNNFLNALSKVYKLPAQSPIFTDSLTITCADLAASVDLNKPGSMIAAQLKLFFETKEDNPELFLDIKEKQSVILLSEKDSSYRAGIIEALSKKKN